MCTWPSVYLDLLTSSRLQWLYRPTRRSESLKGHKSTDDVSPVSCSTELHHSWYLLLHLPVAGCRHETYSVRRRSKAFRSGSGTNTSHWSEKNGFISCRLLLHTHTSTARVSTIIVDLDRRASSEKSTPRSLRTANRKGGYISSKEPCSMLG